MNHNQENDQKNRPHDLLTTDSQRFAFLGFVGDGLFRGLYWEKTYLCSRNRKTEGSAQAGGLRQKHKRQNPINN